MPSFCRMHSLTTVPHSEAALSVDATVQVYAPVGRRHTRPGCEMGLEFVLVLPYALWPPARLQLYSWK